jgi:hypothetical protein
MSRRLVLAIALLTSALTACADSGVEEIHPTSTPTVDYEDINPTSTLEAESQENTDSMQIASEPTNTSTPIPSATPTPQSTVFPTVELPEVELSENGPWLIVSSDSLLYAFNSDGSGKTLLVNRSINSYSISPSGRQIAYITDVDLESYTDGLQLRIIDITNRQDELITNLQDSSFADPDDFEEIDLLSEAERAILMGSPRWSNNGKFIAFIGQTLGPTADLYVYDLDLDAVTQLTDGPSQAYGASWSPDDSRIYHSGAWSFGTGAGYSDAGSWVVSRDGKEIIETTTGMGSDYLIRWQNSERLIIGSWSQPCGIGFLQSYRITTGESTDIWPYYLNGIAYNPSTGKLAISVPNDFDFCMSEDQPTGLYIIDELGSEPRLIPNIEDARVSGDPSNQGIFLLTNSSGTYRLYSDDTIEKLQDTPARYREYSKRQNLWLWFGSTEESGGIWVGDYINEPVKIFNRPITDANWSPNGNSIVFISEDDGFLYLAESPDYHPVIVDEDTIFDEWTRIRWTED